MKPPLLAGLELGAHRFTLVVGRLIDRHRGSAGPPSLVLRAVESVPAQGIQRGVLSDPIECSDAIARLIRQTEKSIQARVPKVLAALYGNHVTSANASASIPITEPTAGISRRDVERVTNTCRTLSLDYDRQILHAFERGFAVDGQAGIKDPVGLSGAKLTVQMHLVTALSLAVSSWLKVLHRAGVEVDKLVLPGLAAAEAVLSDLDRDLGVTLICMGECLTEILLFTDGSVRETFLIPWGTDHLTESMGRALKLPKAGVEQLLEQVPSLEDPSSDLAMRVKSGSLTRSFPQGQVVQLVKARCKELLGRVEGRLKESPYFRESAAGVVVVGPLARLEGFIEMVERDLNMPVRLGTPKQVELDPQLNVSVLPVTAVGLILNGVKSRFSPVPSFYPGSPWARLVHRGRLLLEEYF